MAEQIGTDGVVGQVPDTEDTVTSIERDEALEKRRIKLELVRLSKEILIENSRHKNVDERDVSSSDITTMAESLNTYIYS